MISPRVSICIPTYCQVDFLRKALQSIQAQSFVDYELIISDDTPDDSVFRLLELFNFGEKLRYYHNTTQLGSPANWNEATRKAKGCYIKILHHDDRFLSPNSLSDFVQMLDEHPEANFACCANMVEDIASGKERIHKATPTQLAEIMKRPEVLFCGNLIGAPSATIYRNYLGIDYDENMKWLVDIDFYIRILKKNACFIYSQDALVATTSGAHHQITNAVQNSALVELFEYSYLYQKFEKLPDYNDASIDKVWFRLLEKYKIYSPSNLYKLNFRFSKEQYEILLFFIIKYNNQWFERLPQRFYVNIKSFIKYLIHWILKNR